MYRILKDESGKTIRLPDFSNLKLKKRTRSSNNTVCDCFICELARTPKEGKFSNVVLPKRESILTDITNKQTSGDQSTLYD